MSQPRSALAAGLALSLAGSLLSAGIAQAAAARGPATVTAGAAHRSAKPHPPAAAPPPAAPPATVPPAAPPAAGPPVPGRVHLSVLRAGGSPPFVIAPGRIVVQGVVVPYVGAQKVKLSVYRWGRKIAVKTLAVQPTGNGAGRFRLAFASSQTGPVQVRAVHYGTAAQAQFTARSPSVHFISPSLAPGAQGESVRVLQSELNALHYVVSLSGTFDEATARAVIAYRKMAGLERVPFTNSRMFQLLRFGAGNFHVRYRSDGRHVEADLTRQVLAEIEAGGRVHALYEISSGKPETPTVIGRFRVYEKTPGFNAKGMLDSNYFIAGYAIHGYAEVPTFAASHGCLRVPIPNAASIFAWVQMGTPVDVYNEGGGGSHSVSGHAGP
jgi:L,D-transpeptidase catalytic domain/Putative peptidoglycan binding domain